MNNKTYDLEKASSISIIVSVILILIIYSVSLTLGRFQNVLLPDTGAAWYFWKLPKANLAASLTAWGLYIIHQVTIWFLIVKLKKQKMPDNNTITRLNVIVLLTNLFFIILHIIQTALFYDGLAQQVPVFTSQFSVILMLVMILVMLNNRRGLFFGKKISLPKKGVTAILKSHSFYISWALIYTFWFHPTEGTLGHLLGFLYIFFLLIQLSLAHTSIHMNIKWITFLEIYVAFHGALVAMEAANGMWPMFLFGFLMMFIVTGSHGIIKKKTPKIILYSIYSLFVLAVYSNIIPVGKSISDIHQITWIPIILYLLVYVMVWSFNGGYILIEKLKKKENS